MAKPIRVYLEVGGKRTFAGALDWPGWARAGRTEEEALAALAAYAPRYARVARRARLPFSSRAHMADLEVAERLRGGSGTEFGVPSGEPALDRGALTSADLDRDLRLLRACWDTFDRAAGTARGVTLTVGPRGGGRSLEKIVAHVREAEEAYLGQLGAKLDPAARSDRSPEPIREALLEALRARVEGRPFTRTRNTRKPWSPGYFVRRTAWHALDHAWEIEDRSAGR